MAEKRMLSKVISVSEKVNLKLKDCFHMLLYTWMIPHSDDFGRLTGSPAKVKALVVPMLDYTISDVEIALHCMSEAELIEWYEIEGDKYIEIVGFSEHQSGLQRKTASKFPAPPNSNDNNRHLTSNNRFLNAGESDIEELVILNLENNKFIEDDDIVSTERQLRIGNSYIDILALGSSGRRYLIELKRQRLSNASIDQIIKYRDLLEESEVCSMLIGNGMSSNFDIKKCEKERINVLIYDDHLKLSSLLLNDVKCHEITLSNVTFRTEGKGTEQKGRELNRTEGNNAPSDLKDYFLNLIKQCDIKNYTLHHLDIIYSYIGVLETEVIEAAIKKGQDKHVNYVTNTLEGMRKDGVTKESLFSKTKVTPIHRSSKPHIPIVQPTEHEEMSEEERRELLELAKQLEGGVM